MSAKVDQFCSSLRDRLNSVEARVQAVKTSLQDLPARADKVLQVKIDQARSKIRAQKERVEKTRANLKAWGEEKKSETPAMIGDWKSKHDARKLHARAERAEAYAEAAVVYALASIDEAEAAILDAVSAQIDADPVK